MQNPTVYHNHFGKVRAVDMKRESAKDAPRKRLKRLAWFLDSSIRLPFLNYRIGADGVIGLLPGIGDTLGALFSSYIVLEAAKLGTSKSVLIRMMLNIALETIVGLIPVVGDIFDMGWKANQRNVRLLDTYLNNPGRTRSQSRIVIAVVVLGLIAFISLVFVLGIIILRWVWQLVTSV